MVSEFMVESSLRLNWSKYGKLLVKMGLDMPTSCTMAQGNFNILDIDLEMLLAFHMLEIVNHVTIKWAQGQVVYTCNRLHLRSGRVHIACFSIDTL